MKFHIDIFSEEEYYIQLSFKQNHYWYSQKEQREREHVTLKGK